MNEHLSKDPVRDGYMATKEREVMSAEPQLTGRWWANEFLSWADHPAASGMVPVHPDTLRKVAKLLRGYDGTTASFYCPSCDCAKCGNTRVKP